ncbi:uncharacterized protein [Aristolochia californica]|uniref:uncharacterized protein n=1 Tax=Aristolochia californica TaxID=171875 RepID=UPI0035D59124
MFDTRTTRKGEYRMSRLRSLIEQGKVRNYSTVVEHSNNVLHSRAILEDIAMARMMQRKLVVAVALSTVDTELPDMARDLDLLILLVGLTVWKAAIFQPVSPALRFAALESFALPDGSFGSPEETYVAQDYFNGMLN